MRVRAWAAAALAVAALAVAGCGGGGGGDAQSPATTAPGTTAPATATTAPATTAGTAPTTAAAPLEPGNAGRGQQVFAAAPCAGCHAGLGTRAGFGPKLAGQGLTKQFIHTTVVNGRGQMPAGLVTGQQLEDVVAYVYSLQ